MKLETWSRAFHLVHGVNLGLSWGILLISFIAFSLPESLILLAVIASLFMFIVEWKDDEAGVIE